MKLLGEGVGQLRVFLLFLAVGAIVGLLYTFGEKMTKSTLSAVIFDLLFGVLSATAVFWLNIVYNNGQVRAYVFVALSVGCKIAYFICNKPLDKLCKVLYNRLTSKNERQDNGTTVLQKINFDFDGGGNFVGTDSSLHPVDNAVANGIVEK